MLTVCCVAAFASVVFLRFDCLASFSFVLLSQALQNILAYRRMLCEEEEAKVCAFVMQSFFLRLDDIFIPNQTSSADRGGGVTLSRSAMKNRSPLLDDETHVTEDICKAPQYPKTQAEAQRVPNSWSSSRDAWTVTGGSAQPHCSRASYVRGLQHSTLPLIPADICGEYPC